jgi:PAS domain S-box-containing protein
MSFADRRNPRPLTATLLARRGWRLVIALAAVVIAALIPYSVAAPFGFAESFVLFTPIILLVGMFDGFWPGIFFTFISTFIARYLFLEPRHAIAIADIQSVTGVLPFVVLGIGVSFVGDLLRRRTQRLKEFEKAVQGLQEMIVVIDRDYRYLIANDAFLRYRGMKREEVIGHHVGQVLSPGVFENSVKEKLDECFAGKIVQYEMRYEYPVRGERDLLISYFPIEGKHGIDRVACVLQDMTDLRQSEHSLRLFRRLIDASNDSVLVVDPGTYRVLDVNERACRDLGYTRAELLSMKMPELDATADEGDCEAMLDSLKLGDALLVSRLYSRKNRSTYPVEVSLKYVELERSYVIAVSRDVSERLKAEDAVRESEDRYRDLVEHSEDLVCTHDLAGRLLSVNATPARILGYEPAELLNMAMRDLIVPQYRDLFDAYLTRIKITGAEKGLLMVQSRTGEPRIWEYNNTLRTEGVASPVVRGMAHDITERRKAELALSDSEKRYRRLFEQNLAGVVISTVDGRVVDCNNAWASMLGYGSAEEIRGRQAADLYFDAAERSTVIEELKRVGALREQEIQLLRKDGTPVWVLFSVVLLDGPHGTQMAQGTLIDISKRKRAEEDLVRREQDLRRSEERFRVALKDSPITVFNQDRDLRYTWIYNPQLYWQFDVLGKTDEDVFGPKKSAKLTSLKRQVLTTGVALRDEVAVRNNGKGFAFDMTIEPLFDSNGNVVGITGACMDIAKIRELADRLQDSRDRLQQEKSYLETEIRTELGFEHIIGESPALREVLKKARIVAPTDSTVLLLGETGTGKELVARSLHSLSTRHDKTFVKLNCAAVPSGLLESELFGHEKGAFTSAVSQKIGRIELADKGTLFLDEIGELPQELQPKLLRVLQDREFERLGGVHTLRVDVRIISATNRDLLQDVLDKNFREDLYYRLNVFPIQLPPLRDRREDIAILVQHFVEKHARRMGKHIDIIPDESMRILTNWKWPGNVRELENMIERMMILSGGNVLAAPPAGLEATADSASDDLSEMEREHIIHVLRQTNGVLSGAEGAAVRLGLKRTTLQSMLKRFGIEAGDFRRGNGAGGHN